MVRWSEMPSSTTLPSPLTLLIPYPSPRQQCQRTYHKDNKRGAEQGQCGKPNCLQLQPRRWPCRRLHPVWDCPRRAYRSSRCRFCWWRRRGAGWQIVITNLPSISAGGETTQAQGGLSSGQGTSKRRRDQQRASMFRRSKAASRQQQLLTTCVKLKELCKNGKLQTTPHSTIMEQLQNRADRFRKQGQLRDEELEGTTSGESQEYWLLAIRAAREESRLLATVNDEQQSRPRKRQQRA